MAKRRGQAKGLQRGLASVVRRVGLATVLGVVGMLQIPGCNVVPFDAAPGKPSVVKAGSAAHAAGMFDQCPQHFPGFVPAVAWPGQQRALCFDGFAVLHSGQSKTPVYVVERLDRASVEAAKGVKRVDRFYPEARLPAADRAQLADYAGSGYDRGHMAPAGDMATESAKAQSFSLANMVPQAPELNQRDWNQIEQATRKYAARAGGDVFVFTGPSFTQRPSTIGPGQVWVPGHTWKVVYSRGERRVWAYWMENSAGKHSLKPISYQEFTQRSGLRLLPDSEP